MKNPLCRSVGLRAQTGRLGLILTLLLAASLGGGCGQLTERDPAEMKAEIERSLDAYLPKLADAYAAPDANLLEGVAVKKEIASIEKLVDELAARGEVIEPTLRSFTIEDIIMVSQTGAIVTVMEVWDLKIVSIGSRATLKELPGQRNRVKYQMSPEDGIWMVYYRQVVDRDMSS